MTENAEIEFIESIDACFPYRNENEWKQIIDKGTLISDNSSFMVLYEICGAPREISQARLLEIFDYWNYKFEHPLKKDVCIAAISMIKSQELSVDESTRIMNIVRGFSNQYNALAISYCACCDEDKLDDLYNKIITEWKCNV